MSWSRIGVHNDIYDWVANTFGLTFVDPNTWIEEGHFDRDGLYLNGRGRRRLGQLYARVSGLEFGESAGSKMLQNLENGNYRTRDTGEMRRSLIIYR